MRLTRFILLVGVAVGFSACAIPTRQTDALLQDRGEMAERHEIAEVPYVLQEENHCGPATLAMVLAHQGRVIPVETLLAQVYTPGKKGSFQSDLVSSARRNGMIALEIRGMVSALKEIEAGHPVVTLENLGLSWYPRWHYAVAFGYELAGPSVTLHSGPDRALKKDMRKFERSWMDSGYWGLVVLNPGELAVSVSELDHSVAASALEQIGLSTEAERAYLSILKEWPESLSALIGMGNLRYGAGDMKASVKYLREATRAHPESAVAWHNLATAQGAAKLLKDARVSAARALELVAPTEVAQYRESLREWVAESGSGS